MSKSTQADRIDWPPGFSRTPPEERERYPGGFEVSRKQAFNSILKELDLMDAYNIDVQTNAPHVKEEPHRPYHDRDPDDPAVVVYFDRDGDGYCAPCDRWDNLRDNARAIAQYLNSKRAIERYGVSTVDTEMSTQALPSGDEDVVVAGDGREPHEVLGVAPDAPDEVVRASARRLAANVHPDRNEDGDLAEFKQIQRAKEALLADE